MENKNQVIILGSGAIGLALASSLLEVGRDVCLVRTSITGLPMQSVNIVVNEIGEEPVTQKVNMVSLDQINSIDGVIAVTAKAFANEHIANQLKTKGISAPIILMQNGLDIEGPFLDAGFKEVYRCILYTTSQKTGDLAAQYRSLRSCPVGLMSGSPKQMQVVVNTLHSEKFRFHVDENITFSIWEKVIFNAVYNTICPLLEVDNGVFMREPRAVALARKVIDECSQLAAHLGIVIDPDYLQNQIIAVSRGSDGQRTSTVDDIKLGRHTELAVLNQAIVNVAEKHALDIDLTTTKLLGELAMLKAKAALQI